MSTTTGSMSAATPMLFMNAERKPAVSMITTIIATSRRPARRMTWRPMTLAMPVRVSPSERMNMAHTVITAVLEKPLKASSGETSPVIASVPSTSSATTSMRIHSPMNRTRAAARMARTSAISKVMCSGPTSLSWRLQAPHDDAADGIAGAEGADHAHVACAEPLPVAVEGDDGAGGRRVGELVQHHRRLVLPRVAAVLAEQFAAVEEVGFGTAIDEAEVVAYVVRVEGGELRPQHLPALLRTALVGALQHHGRADVAEDEVRIPAAPVDVGRGDLRVHHEDPPGGAAGDRIHGILQAERGRRAGHVHVVGIAARADGMLHLDRQRGIGPLQVGAGQDDRVDVAALET